jgi:hypothetical protein
MLAEGDVVFSYISSVKLFVPPAYNLPYYYVEKHKDRVLRADGASYYYLQHLFKQIKIICSNGKTIF